MAIDENPVDQLSVKERSELDDPDDYTIEVCTGDTIYPVEKCFKNLGLSKELLNGLYVEMRFGRPSNIQANTLPMMLTPPYKNLIVKAPNGSGKSTCFVLGMLSRVDPTEKAPQALCICPTEEVARQNFEVLQKMSKYTGITAKLAVPETVTPINKLPPITSQVIIGEPCAIKKRITFEKLSVVSMKILVFDEADHVFDKALAQGSVMHESTRIMNDIKKSAPNCQVLLFSAIFTKSVNDFVTQNIHNYNQLLVKEEMSLVSVKHFKVQFSNKVECSNESEKVSVITHMILELGQMVGQTIIFVGSDNNARFLHEALVKKGYAVSNIKAVRSREDRDRKVQEFKEGLTQVLISDDTFARGFDQRQVNLVVNYDLPVQYRAETEPNCGLYMHRAGRAGRFGHKGAVFNLISDDGDNMVMDKIEHHFGNIIAKELSYDCEEDFEAALKEAGLLRF